MGNATTFRGASCNFNAANQPTDGQGKSLESFDAAGNQTSWQTHTLSYDAQNHLTESHDTTNNVDRLTAGYDASGIRLWKSDGSNTTYFIYDGSQLLYEMNAQGSATNVMTWGPPACSRAPTW